MKILELKINHFLTKTVNFLFNNVVTMLLIIFIDIKKKKSLYKRV